MRLTPLLLAAAGLLCVAWTDWERTDPSEGKIRLVAGGGPAEGYEMSWERDPRRHVLL